MGMTISGSVLWDSGNYASNAKSLNIKNSRDMGMTHFHIRHVVGHPVGLFHREVDALPEALTQASNPNIVE
jgi:hypothetical protein